MKKLAIVAALLLVAFTACKKEEEQQQEQPAQEQPAQEYLTADFIVKVGYKTNGYYPQDLRSDNFSVVVYDQSKKADSYLWEWGDGTSSRGVSECYPSIFNCEKSWYNEHKYSESGTYTITLTVANGDGETDCKSKTITIL